VKISLQIEPPICGTIAGSAPHDRFSEAMTNCTQGLSGSVLVALSKAAYCEGGFTTFTMERPCSSRCFCSAGIIFFASVPATKRIWQLATAFAGTAPTGCSGVPAKSASTWKTFEAYTRSVGVMPGSPHHLSIAGSFGPPVWPRSIRAFFRHGRCLQLSHEKLSCRPDNRRECVCQKEGWIGDKSSPLP